VRLEEAVKAYRAALQGRPRDRVLLHWMMSTVRRKDRVPYDELSSPARSAHRWTMRAYCRVDNVAFPANCWETNTGPSGQNLTLGTGSEVR
jgi:hypothetical protein